MIKQSVIMAIAIVKEFEKRFISLMSDVINNSILRAEPLDYEQTLEEIGLDLSRLPIPSSSYSQPEKPVEEESEPKPESSASGGEPNESSSSKDEIKPTGNQNSKFSIPQIENEPSFFYSKRSHSQYVNVVEIVNFNMPDGKIKRVARALYGKSGFYETIDGKYYTDVTVIRSLQIDDSSSPPILELEIYPQNSILKTFVIPAAYYENTRSFYLRNSSNITIEFAMSLEIILEQNTPVILTFRYE